MNCVFPLLVRSPIRFSVSLSSANVASASAAEFETLSSAKRRLRGVLHLHVRPFRPSRAVNYPLQRCSEQFRFQDFALPQPPLPNGNGKVMVEQVNYRLTSGSWRMFSRGTTPLLGRWSRAERHSFQSC